MWFVLFLLLPGAATALLTCTTKNGVVESTPDVLCAECHFEGYVDPITTGCVTANITGTTTTITVNATTMQSRCSLGDGECESSNGTCVPSVRGALCAECSNQGLVVPTEDLTDYTCQCYNSRLDPRNQCRPGLFFNTQDYVSMELERTFEKVTCKAHQSPMYGCFEDVDSSHHKYGDPDPPVPYRCCNPIYGPPPGELREEFVPGQPFQECNTFGGPDANLGVNDTSFHTCNGHGTFNFTTRTCTCDRGWTLDVIGRDINGTLVESCIACSRFYGPKPTPAGLYQPPYCSALYAPDPLTNMEAECSGHGVYYADTRSCVCYSNATMGYWDLGKIGTWDDDGSVVQSCVVQFV